MTEHAKARAKERYGLDLTDADVLSIVAEIRSGGAVLQRRHGTSEVYLLMFQGVLIRPVFLPEPAALVTFLDQSHRITRKRLKQRRAKYCSHGRKARERRREPSRQMEHV